MRIPRYAAESVWTNQVTTLVHAEVAGAVTRVSIQGHCLQSFQLGLRNLSCWRALE